MSKVIEFPNDRTKYALEDAKIDNYCVELAKKYTHKGEMSEEEFTDSIKDVILSVKATVKQKYD